MKKGIRIGVTGEIGAGKTYLCRNLVRYCEDRGVRAQHIEVDIIRREVEIEHPGGDIFARIQERVEHQVDPEKVAFVEWAMLAEDGFLQLVDDNLLSVSCEAAIQHARLAGGDLPDEEIQRRIRYQRKRRMSLPALSVDTTTDVDYDEIFDYPWNPHS